MKPLILPFLLAATTSVHGYEQFLHVNGNTSGPPFDDPTFSSAKPNATRDVGFNNLRGQNWTWTLSISEVANSTFAPDDLFAYTTYSFKWPSDGNINDAVSDAVRNDLDLGVPEQCLYNVWAKFPQSVSNAWDPTSSSCTSAIGKKCEQYILDSMKTLVGCPTANVPSLNSESPCADSFGGSDAVISLGYPFGNASAPSNQTALNKGDTVAWTLSDPYSTDNTTAFGTAEDQLHVVIVTNVYGRQILCNRIGSGTTQRAVISMMSIAMAAMIAVSIGNM